MRKNGFTITEVLIGVAILGVLVFVLMELVVRTMESQRTVTQRQAASSIQLAVSSLLSDRAICDFNFNIVDTAVTVDPISEIRSSLTPLTVAFREGDLYENRLVQLTNIQIVNYRPYAASGPEAFRGTVDLVLKLAPSAPNFAATEVQRTVTLLVELNGYSSAALPATRIRTCRAVGADLNNIWTRKTNGDIFYNGFNVGIGTTNPSQKLEVAGNVLAQAFLHSSDARLKTNIRPAPGICELAKLDGVQFTWKNTGHAALGVTAQNVESVFPEAVVTNPETQMKAVDYDQLVGPLIESVKDLARENRELERQVKALEEKVEAQKR